MQKWRIAHSDWQSLASFISTKNTGRRFKQKVKTEKEKKIDRLLAEEEIEKLKEQIKGQNASKLFLSKNKIETVTPNESINKESDHGDGSDSDEYITCFEEFEKTPSPDAKNHEELEIKNDRQLEKLNHKNKKLMAIKEFDLDKEAEEIQIDKSFVTETEFHAKVKEKGSFFLRKDEVSDDESENSGNEQRDTIIPKKRKEKKNMDSIFVKSLKASADPGKNFSSKKYEVCFFENHISNFF